MIWALQIDIYEAEAFPVVRHVFYGRTRPEAEEFCLAHCGADRFLEGCLKEGTYRGLDCTVKTSWKRIEIDHKAFKR